MSNQGVNRRYTTVIGFLDAGIQRLCGILVGWWDCSSTALTRDSIPVSQSQNDEQSSARDQDYASAIGLLESLFDSDMSRPCQPEKLIPLLPGPGFDPSFSGHNDRRAIISEWTLLRLRLLSHRGWLPWMGEDWIHKFKIITQQDILCPLSFSWFESL